MLNETNKFNYRTPRIRIERFFDEHPNPANIEYFDFQLKDYEIEIFIDFEYQDLFLIKVTCRTAKRADYLKRLTRVISEKLGIQQILWNKKLFFLQNNFFQC